MFLLLTLFWDGNDLSVGLLISKVLSFSFSGFVKCHALVDATLVRGQEFAKVLRVSTKIRQQTPSI